MTLIRAAALLFAALLAACASTPPPGEQGGQAVTILVSIDGFRADYLDRNATPAMSKLAREGVRGSMSPSFPSVTFPNHYTLVTGKTPDHNGIVNNRMEDARCGSAVFSMSPSVADNACWWAEATPIWVSAERQGIRTATMFWPSSDYELQGVRPTKWRLFDEELPSFARVDQLLRWLDVPASGRPKLLTLYFDIVDTAGHHYGPDAPETVSATAEVDAAIGRLVDGLRQRGIAANLVIVADHGMANVSEERIMDMRQMVSSDVARVLWDGQTAGIYPAAGRVGDAERALLGRKEHGECWRKGEMPARFGYGTNARVPPIVCLADLGWTYRNRPLSPDAAPYRGAHGFDPDAPEMAAVFVAHGPAFRAGAQLAKFPNVSVYPLLAKLAGVTPEANDGSLKDTAAGLR